MSRIIVTLTLLLAGLNTFGELKLPLIPDNLRTPSARADYLAIHFYDSMKWDSDLNDDREMKQDWANFLSVLPHCTTDGRQAAVYHLMHSIPAELVDPYAELASEYLFSIDSELADESTYIMTLGALSTHPGINAARAAGFKAQHDYLAKNQPGSVATDITVTPLADPTRNEQLHSFKDKSRYVMLVFHDPDCEECHETLQTLSNDPKWLQSQHDGTLTVVTAEITDETDDLYPILSVPSIYLLEGDSLTVISRNLPLSMTGLSD